MAESDDQEHEIINNQTRILKARVAGARRLSPHLAEVTVAGDDFRQMPDLGPDAFLYLFAPRPGEVRPAVEYDFSWDVWRDQAPEERAQGRYYTVRRFRREMGEVDFQMLLHETGPLSAWASRASAGDEVALWGPRASFKLPPAGTPVLLAADHSGMPAMATILEALPAEATGVAFIELDSEDDRIELAGPSGVKLSWLFRGGEPRGALLTEAVKQVTDAGPGWYAWAGAENAAVAAIRTHLRKERGMPGKSVCAIGYWQEAPA